MDWGSARVRYVSAGSSKAWWRALVAARSLRPDVVFVNGFFAVRFSMIPSCCRGWAFRRDNFVPVVYFCGQ